MDNSYKTVSFIEERTDFIWGKCSKLEHPDTRVRTDGRAYGGRDGRTKAVFTRARKVFANMDPRVKAIGLESFLDFA